MGAENLEMGDDHGNRSFNGGRLSQAW